MTRQNQIIGTFGIVLSLVLGTSVASAACPTFPTGFTCKCNGDDTKWVCATWDQGSAPVLFQDFTVDYECTDCEDAPEVKFIQGGTGETLGWELYSEVISTGAPANLGDVLLASDVTPDGAIFEVTILNGTGAGAANVSSIVLDSADVNWTGSTEIKDAAIFGNVTGAITLIDGIEDGEVTGLLFVLGSVVGPITIPKVSGEVRILGSVTNLITLDDVSGFFAVTGDANGGATVSTLSGSLSLNGTVPNGKTVTIEDFTDTGSLLLGTLGGRLELLDGIPSSCPSAGPCTSGTSASVTVNTLSGTGVIDLNGADVAGIMTVVKCQNSSQIIAGGAVSGFIYPGWNTGGYFNGTLTVSSVSAISTLVGYTTPNIEPYYQAPLNGTINVTGSVAGQVQASGTFTGEINVGSVAASGLIRMVHDALGTILVSGTLLGTVEVVGDLGGSIRTTAGGALGSTGKIEVTGALTGTGKIFVHGLCDGAIQIGEQTDSSTLIHLFGGLGSSGTVEVNTSRGVFDAGGTIHVGQIAYIFFPDVTYDGCTRIYNDGPGGVGGGNLNGELKVFGCHATHDPLNICIDGADNGNVNIVQTGCIPVVGWSCGTCP